MWGRVVVQNGNSPARLISSLVLSLVKQTWPNDPLVRGESDSTFPWGHCEDGMRSTKLSKCGYLFLPVLSLTLTILTSLRHTSFKLICSYREQVTFLPRTLWGRQKCPYSNNEKSKMASGLSWAHLSRRSGTTALCLVCRCHEYSGHFHGRKWLSQGHPAPILESLKMLFCSIWQIWDNVFSIRISSVCLTEQRHQFWVLYTWSQPGSSLRY